MSLKLTPNIQALKRTVTQTYMHTTSHKLVMSQQIKYYTDREIGTRGSTTWWPLRLSVGAYHSSLRLLTLPPPTQQYKALHSDQAILPGSHNTS